MSARDGYTDYYTEKLWQLVPEVYRNADATLPRPDALRQIVEIIANDAARVRRSIDRLWEDQHIETCDDWAVPYLGDLVGARLVSARDRRGRRVDVANAIYFRRRRGTPEVLDTLIRAMSGWDVVLVEGFRRIARTRHRLDALPHPDGPYTSTPPGGTADLRRPVGADLADGPFGEYFHTLDVRLLRGKNGRFGVRKLNFHLYRFKAYRLAGVDPVLLQDPNNLGLLRTFTIDPSGRDIPLFIDAEPPARDGSASTFAELNRPLSAPREWHVTQAMRCRLLGHVRYEISASHVLELTQLPNPPLATDLAALGRVRGVRFESESTLRSRLREFGAVITDVPPAWYRELVRLCLAEDTGKAQLYPGQVEIAVGAGAVPCHEIGAGELLDRTCQPVPAGNLARLTIDVDNGRFATVSPNDPANPEPLVLRYAYGFSGDIGAGPYTRGALETTTMRTASNGAIPDAGLFQGDGLTIADHRTYRLAIRSDTPVPDATLQAEDQKRPYVLLSGDDDNPRGANLLAQAEGQTFMINGGWYGSNDPDAVGDPADFVIEGLGTGDGAAFDFDAFEIRHATFDPGGVRADGIRIPSLRLRVRAQIQRLVIRRSIVGPVEVVRDAESPFAHVEELVVCDSIVDASQVAGAPAIVNAFGTVVLESSTVIGNVQAHLLRASDSLVVGQVRVVNNQAGCFRFSASAPGPDVRLPPRYRDVQTPLPRAFFGSLRFGDPQYAQLSVAAPPELTRGAENGSEMGAFSHLLQAVRLQSVRAKLDEFGPVGMLAQFLFEGDLQALSALHSGPITPAAPDIEPAPLPSPGDEIPSTAPAPAPALPTSCGGDEPAPPPAEAPAPPDALSISGADLGGAPEFWRRRDWYAEELPLTRGRAVEGIAFDRVDAVLEYDARRGTLPSAQGWRSTGDESTCWLDEGTLAFEVTRGSSIEFTAEQMFPSPEPIQVHGYAMVAVASDRDRVDPELRDLDDSFEFSVVAHEHEGPWRGLRLGRGGGLREPLRQRTLAGDARRDLGPEGEGTPSRGWHRLSLQGHFERDQALVSTNGRLERGALRWFGETPGGNPGRALGARFAFAAPGDAAHGRLRNLVVSAAGRFVRAWWPGVAPHPDPLLRLVLRVPQRAEGTVPLLLRYGARAPGYPVTGFPQHQIATELTVRASEAQPTIDLRLPDVGAGEPLWITLERPPHPGRDTVAGTIRLHSGSWLR